MTNSDLVSLLERVLAHHTEAAGLSPEIVADKAAFTDFLNEIERRAEELKTDVSAALTALKSGDVVLVPAEPTEEMIDEAAQVYPDWHERSLKGIMIGDVCKQLYRAMLACCAKGKS